MAIAEVDAIGVENTNKPADELVLVDAYWIKEYRGEKIKVRVLPHQKPVDLYMEFVYKFDDDKHNKDAAPAIDVKFKVKGTIFDEKTTITIDSSKIKSWYPVRKYEGPKVEYWGKQLFYCVYNKKFLSDLYPLEHRMINDEIVLLDAYWEKEGLKLRVLPHQKKVNLVVKLGFKYNKVNYDKEKAKFELRFMVPNTFFFEEKGITIEGKDLLQCDSTDNISRIKDKYGNDCFLYTIKDFTSDLSEVEFSNS